jgi:dTMP kinase
LDKARRSDSYGQVSQRGIFISFEGVDGCGKSTQIKELRRRMRSLGDKLVITREPGGTLLGEEIRKILQPTEDTHEITDRAELLLFAASRAQLVTDVLEPALDAGKHVIADRFLDSTAIYQGEARGLDRKTVDSINHFAVGTCMPDITFLMDIAPSDMRHRLASRKGFIPDRFEKLPESFFHDVRNGYLALAKSDPKRFVIIDAMQKITTIADSIWKTLTERYDGLLG